MLQCEEEDITAEYQHLIDANNEISEKLLPKLKKPVRKVVLARAKLTEAYKKYSVVVTRENQREVEIAKCNLDTAHI